MATHAICKQKNPLTLLILIMAIGVTCPLILYSSTKMPWPEMKR
jgi:hypothetical protein